MNITFAGAARTVTGSCYYLEIGEEKLLVDCGMFQGKKELEELNASPWPFNPRDLSYVLLTHAHIDHSGLLPRLKREGFRGKIICTKSTKDLCSIMLPDSGHIHELEAEWQTKRRQRQRKRKVEPLYTAADAAAVLPHLTSVPYHKKIALSPEITIRLQDAGHILGSAIIEMWVKEGDAETKVVFSGDIGSTGQAIVKDPEPVAEADYLFIESTYGNRLHPPAGERYDELLDVIRQAQRDGGLVIIPSFAVGRTQELLFQLHKLFKKGLISDIPVYVDSPLAIEATEVFQSNPEYFDEESASLFARGDNPMSFPGLRFIRSREESQQLNNLKGTAVIISASGMADRGRILHHLKNQLWKEHNHVVFVGYQAEGSIGHKLVSGAKYVRILGGSVRVGAKIHDLSALSAHADKEQLLAWLKQFRSAPTQTFIVHGEEASSLEFAETIGRELGWSTHVPRRGETCQVNTGTRFEIAEAQGQGEPQLELSEAELNAYLQAIEHNVNGLGQALRKYRLSAAQMLQLSEQLAKMAEQLNEMDDRM